MLPRARGGVGNETNEKKMIILHKGPAEHRDAWTSAPRGEPGTPPSVLTPQSPCTIERAVSVGTLYQDTIYASAARTNVTPALLHRTGGVIHPVGLEAHPCAGAPPPSTEPVLERQIGLQFQIRGNNQPSLSILLAARRKARQQGNIDGLVGCLIPLKRLLYDKYKDRAQGG